MLGATRRGATASKLLGTTAQRVIHECACPVAIVPSGYQRPEAGVQVIGAAYAPTDEGREALDAAVALARAAGVRVRAITVLESEHAAEQSHGSMAEQQHEVSPTEGEAGRERLSAEDELAAAVAELGGDVEIDVDVLVDDPADGLIAASRHADMLVMGSRALGRTRRAARQRLAQGRRRRRMPGAGTAARRGTAERCPARRRRGAGRPAELSARRIGASAYYSPVRASGPAAANQSPSACCTSGHRRRSRAVSVRREATWRASAASSYRLEACRTVASGLLGGGGSSSPGQQSKAGLIAGTDSLPSTVRVSKSATRLVGMNELRRHDVGQRQVRRDVHRRPSLSHCGVAMPRAPVGVVSDLPLCGSARSAPLILRVSPLADRRRGARHGFVRGPPQSQRDLLLFLGLARRPGPACRRWGVVAIL